MQHHFHCETKMMKFEGLLVDCCVVESSSIQAAAFVLFICYKNNSPPSPVDHFCCQYFTVTKESISIYGLDFPSFSVIVHWERWHKICENFEIF
jgi:hypothetical protein